MVPFPFSSNLSNQMREWPSPALPLSFSDHSILSFIYPSLLPYKSKDLSGNRCWEQKDEWTKLIYIMHQRGVPYSPHSCMLCCALIFLPKWTSFILLVYAIFSLYGSLIHKETLNTTHGMISQICTHNLCMILHSFYFSFFFLSAIV